MKRRSFCLAIALLGGTGGCDSSSGNHPAPFGIDARPSNASCIAPPRPSPTAGVTVMPAWPQLAWNLPVALRQAPGDSSRWFVVEKGGTVRTFADDPNVGVATLFVDISARVNSQPNEAGLLGMAFHPSFASNHQVFLSYTAPSTNSPANLRSTLSRFTSSDGGKTLDASSEEVLLTLEQPFVNHNGGNILFGPDGYLYMGFGDGGSGGDPMKNGQNTDVLFAKMLRLDVDSGSPYAIPPSNPFAAGGGKKEIYAWGLRNPWRWSFDRATGDLWVGDVGQDLYEEVDKVELGGDYGWNVAEGLHCYDATSCDKAGMIDPVVEYDHTVGNCVIGGYVYNGAQIPSLVGTYLYSDNGSGRLWALTFDPVTGRGTPLTLAETGLSPSSFGEGNDGELYLLPYGSGVTIHKIVPSGMAGPAIFPETLSATGCVDPADATQAAPGLIPYDVNVPLWADGASKRRWLALPDGAQITVGDDGDFAFPIGTVLMKEFSLGGRRLETRLMMRHTDGEWAGYTYEWNDDGKDATLLDGAASKDLGSQTWSFPSRDQCLQCHTAVAGRALGPELAQLNRDFVYSGGKISNQLASWDHIGLFAAPLPSPLPLLAPPDSTTATVEARARGYLHANCSICHRPNGSGQGPADFRYATPLAMMGVCNADPSQGDLGVSGAKLLVPGAAAQSLISLRMHATDVSRMPPLATHIVDPTGTKDVDDWIASLSGCP